MHQLGVKKSRCCGGVSLRKSTIDFRSMQLSIEILKREGGQVAKTGAHGPGSERNMVKCHRRAAKLLFI